MDLKILYLRDAKSMYEGGICYATNHSVGLDLRADLDCEQITIKSGERIMIGTGIIVAPSSNDIAGFVYSRSGLGTRKGLVVSQGVGVIDPDYRGEIFVSILNNSTITQTITKGERFAQLVYKPICRMNLIECDELDSTTRGAGGFGHTGRN